MASLERHSKALQEAYAGSYVCSLDTASTEPGWTPAILEHTHWDSSDLVFGLRFDLKGERGTHPTAHAPLWCFVTVQSVHKDTNFSKSLPGMVWYGGRYNETLFVAWLWGGGQVSRMKVPKDTLKLHGPSWLPRSQLSSSLFAVRSPEAGGTLPVTSAVGLENKAGFVRALYIAACHSINTNSYRNDDTHHRNVRERLLEEIRQDVPARDPVQGDSL
jgi:hypothetical protein